MFKHLLRQHIAKLVLVLSTSQIILFSVIYLLGTALYNTTLPAGNPAQQIFQQATLHNNFSSRLPEMPTQKLNPFGFTGWRLAELW